MSTQLNTLSTPARPRGTLRRLAGAALLAMALSAVANLALYYVAGALFPSVTAWPGAGPGQIVGANSAYLTMGAILFAIVVRLSSQPARHYAFLAVVALLASLALPIGAGFGSAAPGAPAAGAATVVTLSLMHVVTAAISVPLFIRRVLR